MSDYVSEVNEENRGNCAAVQTPVLVDFWAERCGHVPTLAPTLRQSPMTYGERRGVQKR